jgi:type IV secretion system protein VirB11
MLATALGDEAGRLLLDDTVTEIMLNPDGCLWIERLGKGRSFTGQRMSAADAERVIFIIASSIGAVCNKDSPLLSAELPINGSRFQGVLPPLSKRPAFCIRKKALQIFSIEDYVKNGILSPIHASVILEAVSKRKNILIVGGTASGKTTLANAILAIIADTGDRLLIIEDTKELQCAAKDFLALRTKEGVASMTDLLKAAMRLRPDRIIIGEVRGKEALDLLKAWNTGHPGGCATVHADSAPKGLIRLEHLVQEAGVSDSKPIIAEAVDLIIYITKFGASRRVTHVAHLHGLERGDYRLENIPR